MRPLAAILALSLLGAAGLVNGNEAKASYHEYSQTDLDAFMQKVMARRDDNWKKLQQYILDERQVVEIRGPGGVTLWGERRDYTWYLRDEMFVRSPLRFNGVEIGEADRRKYEDAFIRHEKEREKRQTERQRDERAKSGQAEAETAPNMESSILEAGQPQFISSAYFLRFKFEQGKYALVGRETLDGRELLRVEYYPDNLFGRARTREDRRKREGRLDDETAENAQIERLMNKGSRVTLWIDPAAHQIVKYTFDNVSFDFLPARWMLRVDEMHATMMMNQPFPDVWLPKALEIVVGITAALGPFDARYSVDYHDYRRADVTSKVRIKGER